MLSLERVKTCRDLAWDFALTSRMNVTYYQHRIRYWKRVDLTIRVVAALLASASVVGFFKEVGAPTWLIAAFGVASAVCTVVGATFQVTEKVRAFGVLLAEYTAHAGAFERLFHFGCTDESVKDAVRKFEETEQREAKDDPDPDRKLLDECQKAILDTMRTPQPAPPT